MLTAAVLSLGLLGGGLDLTVTTSLWLNFDPTAQNVLRLQIPAALGGGARSTRLVGGVHALVSFDLRDLLSPQGINVNVNVDQIRVAGESFDLFPNAPTGTLCVAANPAGAGSGHLFIPLVGWPNVVADFNTDTFLTGPLGPFLPDGLKLSAHVQSPLQVDLLSLFRNNFQSGPAKVVASAQGTVPSDVLFFGGAGFSMDITLLNSFATPQDPLLTQCDAFLGGA